MQCTHLLLLDSSLPLLKSWNFHMFDPPCILGSTFSPLCYFIILVSFKSLYISLKMNRLNNIRLTQAFHCLSRKIPMMHLKRYDTAKQVRVVLWVFLTPNGWLCTVMITKRSPFYIYLYRVEPIGRLKWKRGFCLCFVLRPWCCNFRQVWKALLFVYLKPRGALKYAQCKLELISAWEWRGCACCRLRADSLLSSLSLISECLFASLKKDMHMTQEWSRSFCQGGVVVTKPFFKHVQVTFCFKINKKLLLF